MNREILFRGKRIDNREWMIGYLTRRPISIQDGNYSPWYIDVPPKDPDARWDIGNVDYSTVGQYTGLNDKNGKKIFGGDIVEYKGDYGYIEWYNVDGMYMIYFDGWCVDISQIWSTELEIIGNIHDNPELLEDG